MQDETDVVLHNSSFRALCQVFISQVTSCLSGALALGGPGFLSVSTAHTLHFMILRNLSCGGHGHSTDDGSGCVCFSRELRTEVPLCLLSLPLCHVSTHQAGMHLRDKDWDSVESEMNAYISSLSCGT